MNNNIKRILILFIAFILIPFAVPVSSDTDTIGIYLTPGGTISIVVNQTAWGPICGLSEENITDFTWANITNEGNIYVDVTVNATDTSSWEPSTAPSHNKFQLSIGMEIPSPTDYIYAGGLGGEVHRYIPSNMSKKDEASYSGNVMGLAADETYIYAGGSANNFTQYWKSNMTMKGTAAYGAVVLDIQVDSDYIYVVGEGNRVRKYWKTNLTQKAVSGDYNGDLYTVCVDDTYVYAGGAVGIYPHVGSSTYQYWKTNLTQKANTASYGGAIEAIIEDTTYIYVAGGNIDKVYQYWKSNLTKKAESVAYGSPSYTIWALADDDTYVYAGGMIVDRVYQIWKSNMTKKTETARIGYNIYQVAQINGYVYAGCQNGVLKQYWSSNMTVRNTAYYGSDIRGLACSTSEQGELVETWTNLLNSPTTLIGDFPCDEPKQFGLHVDMPTSSSTNANQTTIITFTATAD